MKRSLVLLPVLLVALAGAQQTWTKVMSPEGKFSVLMPGEPKMATQKFEKLGYTIPTTIYVLSQPATNYLVAVASIPPEAPASLADSMISAAKDDFLKASGGSWTSDKNASYNGVSGRLLTFKAPNGANGALWLIARGKKLYTLTVAKNKKPYAAEQAKFFGSFKLIP